MAFRGGSGKFRDAGVLLGHCYGFALMGPLGLLYGFWTRRLTPEARIAIGTVIGDWVVRRPVYGVWTLRGMR